MRQRRRIEIAVDKNGRHHVYRHSETFRNGQWELTNTKRLTPPNGLKTREEADVFVRAFTPHLEVRNPDEGRGDGREGGVSQEGRTPAGEAFLEAIPHMDAEQLEAASRALLEGEGLPRSGEAS